MQPDGVEDHREVHVNVSLDPVAADHGLGNAANRGVRQRGANLPHVPGLQGIPGAGARHMDELHGLRENVPLADEGQEDIQERPGDVVEVLDVHVLARLERGRIRGYFVNRVG